MKHLAVCSSPSFTFGSPLPAGQGVASLAVAVRPEDGAPDMPEGCNIQLLPDGAFAAIDGRPGSLPKSKVKAWLVDAGIAAALIADLAALKTPRLIDYEHQTLYAAQNGKPAPAAGWMSNYTYVPGRGLFAFAKWTKAASASIEAEEYRYISPVFFHDLATGRVTRLLHAALTNNPALDGMTPAAANCEWGESVTPVAGGSFFATHEKPMEESMDKIKQMLGLKPEASETEAYAALSALMRKGADAEAAATAATIQGQATLDALAALSAQVTALTAKNTEQEITAKIAAAKKEGKLPAALEEWARDLGKKDPAALSAFLEKAQSIEALKGGTQTNGKEPDKTGAVALTAEQKEVAALLGMTDTEYAEVLKGGN